MLMTSFTLCVQADMLVGFARLQRLEIRGGTCFFSGDFTWKQLTHLQVYCLCTCGLTIHP